MGDIGDKGGSRVGSEPIRKALSSWEGSWGCRMGLWGE